MDGARLALGSIDAILLMVSLLTTAATVAFRVLDGASFTVAVVSVSGSIASLKVALTVLLMQTAVPVSVGLTKTTVGGVVSARRAAVVKVQTLFSTMALPARSVMAVLTVAVNEELAGSGDGLVGVNVAVRAPTE